MRGGGDGNAHRVNDARRSAVGSPTVRLLLAKGASARALWIVQRTECNQAWRPYLTAQIALGCGAGAASAGKDFMYRMLAYGFVGFTALLVVLLLVFWWQESRAAARRRKHARTKS